MRPAIYLLPLLLLPALAQAQSFVDVPTQDPYTNTRVRAGAAAAVESATGLALLSANTAMPAFLGPLGFAIGAGTKLLTVATLGDRPPEEQKEVLERSTAWWVGGATMNLLIMASAAQPLALLGGVAAGLMSWAGPGNPSAPADVSYEDTTANIVVTRSVVADQDWAMGAEAERLKRPEPVLMVANPIRRPAPLPAPPRPRALEF